MFAASLGVTTSRSPAGCINTWMLAVSVKGQRWTLKVRKSCLRWFRTSIAYLNEQLLQVPHPRVIKSHEQYDPGYPRVIYMYRDLHDELRYEG